MKDVLLGKNLADRRLFQWPLAGTVHDPQDVDAFCGYGVDDQTRCAGDHNLTRTRKTTRTSPSGELGNLSRRRQYPILNLKSGGKAVLSDEADMVVKFAGRRG